MAHIYISYAPENFEYAEDVQRHLERGGFSVFIDSSSTEVPEGTVTAKDWRQEIDDAIRDSFALITLLTPHSKTFEYVTYEWMFALGVGIPVIPLLFESTEIPPRLKALNVLDFSSLRRLPWATLLKTVETIRNKIAQGAAASPTLSIGAQSAALVGSGQARTLLDLVNLIRTGSEDKQQAALMALAEIDPDALLRLVQNALRLDELRIPFIQGLIDRTLPPARHVFLSYSRQDVPLMCRLRDDMRKAELTVWTDEALTPGDPSWQLAIEKAIEQAGCVVVILSPDSKRSEWVLAELQYARMHKRVIVPVLMRGTETEAVPMAFINWQWLDLRDEARYGAGLTRLVGALGQYLRRMTPAAV